MAKNNKDLKEGDLMLIRTPPYHKKSLDTDLEGKSGVILKMYEEAIPSSFVRLNMIFEVLIDGSIMKFYNDTYFSRVK